MKQRLFIFASMIPFVASAPAFAQSGKASSSDLANSGSGEIIVTARRVAERLRDVPISITALSAEALENAGISDSRDLEVVTPGLRLEATGVYVQPAMRGVTTNITTTVSEPNVATYIDGVYQPFQVGAVFELPDIQQVQVLKGPQGTLFGRNATGGAILITTKAPDLNDLTGKVSAHFERFSGYGASGWMSVPLVQDRVAMSLTAQYQRAGPFVRDLTRNGERRGDDTIATLRGKLRVVPWDGAEFTITGYYNRRNAQNDLRETNLNGNNRLQFATTPGLIIAKNPWEVANDFDSRSKTRVWSVSLNGEFELGPGKLTTTTAHLDFRNRGLTDIDNTNLFVTHIATNAFNRVTTQEVIYASDDLGGISFVVGGYLFNGFNGADPTYSYLPSGVSARYSDDEIRARSLFGEATLKLIEGVKLIGGVRYSHETRSDRSNLVVPATGPNPKTPIGRASFKAWTPRVSLVAEASRTTNVYATYSEGFKSGIFNSTNLGAALIKPEDMKAYEAGVKHKSGDISLNVAGFYYDYRNVHAQAIITVGNQIATVFQNVPKTRIYGLEIESSWTPFRDFTLSVNGTFLDAKYLQFSNAAAFIPSPTGGNQQISANVAGKQMIRAPEFSGNIMAQYGFDTSAGRIRLTGNVYHSSSLYHDFINRVKQPAHTMVNANIAWAPTENVELSLYGRNLLNEKVISSVILQVLGDHVTYQPPATYGIEATFRF